MINAWITTVTGTPVCWKSNISHHQLLKKGLEINILGTFFDTKEEQQLGDSLALT